jgi:hypothetical protein
MGTMTIAVDPAGYGHDVTMSAVEVRRLPGIVTAAVASIGAGAVHAAATGIHAEHPPLARLFVIVAILQLGVGLAALVRPNRPVAAAVAAVNAGAVAGWIVTRVSGISWIEGLEVKEAPQFADTVCALMGLAAIGAGIAAALVGWHTARPARLMVPTLAAIALTVPAMISGGTHLHNHDAGIADAAHAHGEESAAAPNGNSGAVVPVAADTEKAHAGDDHGREGHHDDAATATTAAEDDTAAATETTAHGHDDADSTSGASADEGASAGADDHATASDDHGDGTGHGTTPAGTDAEGRAWPWPFDPAEPVELGGVEGVTPVQEARAEGLVKRALEQLPQFADVNAIGALGYASIGDGVTGYEHFINRTLIDGDDKFLDPSAPESLVFRVDKATGTKTLVSAMFIAKTGTPMDAFKLTDYAGPLMTWHAHNNLCWAPNGEGRNVIVGLVDANGNCARGVRGGGDNPMVHVWIVAHQCGPFAALEGVGAGGAAVPEAERTDMCREDHGNHGSPTESGGHGTAPSTGRKYDPTKPIDLSGFEGVTEEQQAAAENLVAINVVRLPQWSDHKVAEAAGFRSIGDGVTGHEHFIQWDWINDDVILDPDQPEALVYAPQPDGTKQLVSAMYMLPNSVALEDVPDIGGALMQWHIHDNLCFTKDPKGPRVGGITSPGGGCPEHLQKFPPSAMIHVWITPHPCGPFAALEGIAAGTIKEGEERLCDEVHGGH